MKRHSVIALALTAGALTLPGTPAMAATTHYDYPRTCYDVGNSETACYSTTGHYNATQTPSGNYAYAGQGSSTYSITNAAGIQTLNTSWDYQFNFLNKDGVRHVDRNVYEGVVSYGGMTCNLRDIYLVANGEFRHRKVESTCS